MLSIEDSPETCVSKLSTVISYTTKLYRIDILYTTEPFYTNEMMKQFHAVGLLSVMVVSFSLPIMLYLLLT